MIYAAACIIVLLFSLWLLGVVLALLANLSDAAEGNRAARGMAREWLAMDPAAQYAEARRNVSTCDLRDDAACLAAYDAYIAEADRLAKQILSAR